MDKKALNDRLPAKSFLLIFVLAVPFWIEEF